MTEDWQETATNRMSRIICERWRSRVSNGFSASVSRLGSRVAGLHHPSVSAHWGLGRASWKRNPGFGRSTG
jgi:hypothetical protein